MKSTFTFVLLAVLVIQGAVSIPIPLEGVVTHTGTVMDNVRARLVHRLNTDEAIRNVETSITDAHAQVVAMQHVANNHDQGNHPEILEKSFGPHWRDHLPAIRTGVQTLHDGHITVNNVFKHNPGQHAAVSGTGDQARIYTTPHFHKETDAVSRAGTMLHESTHALLGTHDYHEPNPFKGNKLEAVSVGAAQRTMQRPGHSVRVGYYEKEFNHVNAHSLDPTKNADSWRAFGFHSTQGVDHNVHIRKPEGARPPGRAQPAPNSPSRFAAVVHQAMQRHRQGTTNQPASSHEAGHPHQAAHSPSSHHTPPSHPPPPPHQAHPVVHATPPKHK